VPRRTCIGCRHEFPKRELVRIVRTPTGTVTVDVTGKAAGRGAYLCRTRDCWTAALRRGMLAGALRTAVSEDDQADLERFRDTLSPAVDSAQR
jgi:predicted RNA-binding protein YlxR (DUF448 family)